MDNIKFTFRVEPDGVTNVQAGPPPGFTIIGTLTTDATLPVALYGAMANITFFGQMQLPPVPAKDSCSQLALGQEQRVYFPVGLSREILTGAERCRDKAASEIRIGLSLNVVAAPLVKVAQHTFVAGPPAPTYAEILPVKNAITISREQWLSLLRDMRFSEVALFEVPGLKVGDNIAEEALRFLRKAEDAFRRGDWDGTLANCRLATEGVAKLTTQTPDIQKGFEVLWEKVALAHPKHEGKRNPLDGLAVALGKFQHLGRHVSVPVVPIDRDDALLGLRMTLAMFEYIGQRCSTAQQ